MSRVTKELNKDTECCTVQPNGNIMLTYCVYFATNASAKYYEGQTLDGLVTATEQCQVTYCCLERLTRYEHILGSGGMVPHILNFGSYEGVYWPLYFRNHCIECLAFV